MNQAVFKSMLGLALGAAMVTGTLQVGLASAQTQKLQSDAAAEVATEAEQPRAVKVADPGVAAVFAADVLAKGLAVEQASEMVVKGQDGWLFLARELRHVGIGPFWGEHAAQASRAPNPAQRDPLPAIIDVHEQLKKLGIELILVPVPPKAVIYPDKISSSVKLEDGQPPRVDVHLRAFYKQLADKDITVLDMTDTFLRARAEEGPALYCKQDTHWSGRGCELTARAIAKHLEERPWLKDVPRKSFEVETRDVEINGDLYASAGDSSLQREKLPLTFIKGEGEDNTWRESPVLLMGDSHLLVFHIGGDMHARHAGLADLLARQMGFGMDVVGVRGSGATPARQSVLRRRDNLEGKKVVVWVFTAREFTETMGWRVMPITLPTR